MVCINIVQLASAIDHAHQFHRYIVGPKLVPPSSNVLVCLVMIVRDSLILRSGSGDDFSSVIDHLGVIALFQISNLARAVHVV